jgi:alpha-beta hydrolase superfamily lysophospholipase
MSRYESILRARDGLALSLDYWKPEAEPKAIIVYTHGHGEYATKYSHVAHALNAAGYVWLAHDLRGHGRSGGLRGHTPSYEAYLSDLSLVIAQARTIAPGKPLFLFGHSMGGQITAAYVLDRAPEVAGVLLSAPWLRLKYMPPAWRVMLARWLAGIVPTFAQDTGLDDAVPMTHDAVLLASYPEPELSHSKMTARLGMEALARGEGVFLHAPDFRAPLLLLHGEADGVFDAATSQDFFDRVASPDKTLRLYPGFYHEVLNETERHTVFDDIVHWLNARVP